MGALQGMTSGSFNIGIGYDAGENVTGGLYNIDIGSYGLPADNSVIRIGLTGGVQSATYIGGITGVPVTGVDVVVNSNGQLGVAASSNRYKTDIHDMGTDSEAILALRPVSFRYKPEIDPKGTPQYGLVAEEVEKVSPDLVVRDEKGQAFTVRYSAVNAMLLNEFRKEHQRVEDQQKEIEALKARLDQIDALSARLDALEKASPGR